MSDENQNAKQSADFTTTQWSAVIGLQHRDPALAHGALERLCSRYWRPVYVFIRSRGADRHEAEDLTQSFFAFVLAKDTLKSADRQKGKFRTFLLTSVTNFLANEHDKRRTLKRGGDKHFISLDEILGEESLHPELADGSSAEKHFERRWATTIVSRVLARLKEEYAVAGKARQFEVLESGLTRELNPGDYAVWASALALNEGAARVALHRLRRRFGELLRSEIAHTVATPEEVDEEIRQLFAAISS